MQRVFHRGSKVKDDADSFAFDDETGLLRLVTGDWAVVALREAEANQRDLASVVNPWVVT